MYIFVDIYSPYSLLFFSEQKGSFPPRISSPRDFQVCSASKIWQLQCAKVSRGRQMRNFLPLLMCILAFYTRKRERERGAFDSFLPTHLKGGSFLGNWKHLPLLLSLLLPWFETSTSWDVWYILSLYIFIYTHYFYVFIHIYNENNVLYRVTSQQNIFS